MDPHDAPPPAVLRAFGVAGAPRRLPGGQGDSWAAGTASDRVVLKPVADGLEAEEAMWRSALLADRATSAVGFRVPEPVAAASGGWVAGGWTASRWVDGEPGPSGRWPELLAAARAFHRALADAPRPAFLGRRTHRWAVADRAAWSEQERPLHPAVAALPARLRALLRPVEGPSQLVHGDLAGNVLFTQGLPPAILDLSPYWRPPAYAEAIAVADGLLHHGEGAALLAAAGPAGRVPLVARAVLFRLLDLNEQLLGGAGGGADACLKPYARVTALLEGRTRAGR